MKGKQPKVIFYHIKNNSSKIDLIVAKGEEALQRKKRLLILVPNMQAAEYVDALLWKQPQDSFIPHTIAETKTKEWIAITIQKELNVNEAVCLLNLCTTPPPLYAEIEEIYEIYDETHPEKKEFSEKRLQFYQQQKIIIVKL